jgi:hypothetical protein
MHAIAVVLDFVQPAAAGLRDHDLVAVVADAQVLPGELPEPNDWLCGYLAPADDEKRRPAWGTGGVVASVRQCRLWGRVEARHKRQPLDESCRLSRDRVVALEK